MTTAIFVFLAAAAWSFTVWLAYRIGMGVGMTIVRAFNVEPRRDYEHNTNIN